MHDAYRKEPRVLLLIPSHISADTAEATELGKRPRADYYALQQRLGADILDYSAVDSGTLPVVARTARSAGRAVALAALGYVRAADYDIIFSNGENVGIPLALLMRLRAPSGKGTRPGHVMIGHRLSSRKKRRLLMAVRSRIDAVFVYSEWQRNFAISMLGFDESKLILIPFHADHEFFRPQHLASDSISTPCLVSSAGMEWRDYATLMKAVDGLDVEVSIGAYSPWSRGGSRKDWHAKPHNVTMGRYDYRQLRDLYDRSRLVVVPVHQTDFQAGITTIIEAMSMGKAVIASRTIGMADTLRDGVNGILVPPGNADSMRQSIEMLLMNNPALAGKLGAQARCDVETSLTLDHWVDRLTHVIFAVDSDRHCSATERGAATGRKR